METIKKARKACDMGICKLAYGIGITPVEYSYMEIWGKNTTNIPDIEYRAAQVLAPELDKVILQKQNELTDLRILRESLYDKIWPKNHKII